MKKLFYRGQDGNGSIHPRPYPDYWRIRSAEREAWAAKKEAEADNDA